MITDLAFCQRSVLFAELSKLVYSSDEKYVKKRAKSLGFGVVEYYNSDGAQAYRFSSREDIVIVCRGTEPTCFNDIRADLRAYPVRSEAISRVHLGFKQEVDDIWPRVREDIKNKKKKNLWFAGHSLGGAMATIMASRCYHDKKLADPVEIYTYGSPRVGWPGYVTSLGPMTHHRWVNNNDVVTRVPFWILGYRHHGTTHYINAYGNVRHLTFEQRLKDKFRGFVYGLRNGSIDFFADHSIDAYLAAIKNYRDGYK